MARCSVQGPWQTCSVKRCASCAQYSAAAMDTQHILELPLMRCGGCCTTDAQQTLLPDKRDRRLSPRHAWASNPLHDQGILTCIASSLYLGHRALASQAWLHPA